jgi:sodium pump decarboxylase gamma subunit
MRRTLFILTTLAICAIAPGAKAQIASNLKISEVVTDNRNGLIDETGQHSPWIEICNTSYGTVNIQSCYLTNDRRALEDMSVPERVKLMSQIAKGDKRTALSAQERIVFYADSQPNLGTLHTNFRLDPGKSNFIALFDGDGHTLLDSVTVPACSKPDCSYARFLRKGGRDYVWLFCMPEDVTPGVANSREGMSDDKVAEFKQHDPDGIGMSILGMGIVFSCLALLALFFYFFGKIFIYRARKQSARTAAARSAAGTVRADSATATAGSESPDEEVMVVIAMALKSATANVHDYESGVITIKAHPTRWNTTGGLDYTTNNNI